MDIGGYDAVLEGPTKPWELWFLLSQLAETWPRGCYHGSDVEGDVHAIALTSRPWSGANDVFAYADKRALESWAKHGRAFDNDKAMVQIVVAPDFLTIVGPSEVSFPLIDGIKGLRNRFASDGWSQPVLHVAWRLGVATEPWSDPKHVDQMRELGRLSALMARSDGIVRAYWQGRAHSYWMASNLRYFEMRD